MLQIENEDVVDNALKKKIAHAFGVINIELSARAARRLEAPRRARAVGGRHDLKNRTELSK